MEQRRPDSTLVIWSEPAQVGTTHSPVGATTGLGNFCVLWRARCHGCQVPPALSSRQINVGGRVDTADKAARWHQRNGGINDLATRLLEDACGG